MLIYLCKFYLNQLPLLHSETCLRNIKFVGFETGSGVLTVSCFHNKPPNLHQLELEITFTTSDFKIDSFCFSEETIQMQKLLYHE